MTRFKICCIRDEDELDLAVAAGASAVGLVSAMPSGPGPIDDATIRRLLGRVPPGITSFLLTSRTDTEGLIEQHLRLPADVLQLVDRLDAGALAALRSALPGTRLVQVVHVEDDGAVAQAKAIAPHVDAVLLDSGRPGAVVRELGGTGRVHDWEISRQVVEAVDRPVWLAGGLRPGNVAEAIATVRPFGVDVCSGVRTDGGLDPVKLQAFVRAVAGVPPHHAHASIKGQGRDTGA